MFLKVLVGFIYYILVVLTPIFSASITINEFGDDWTSGSAFTNQDDEIKLVLNLSAAHDFGITTNSYAESAKHTDKIILDPVITDQSISSKLNARNEAVFVYYRAIGNDPFDLYLSLDGNMKGTIESNNSVTIPWQIEWADDSGSSHILMSREVGDDGGDKYSTKRYIIGYEKPANALGKSYIQKIDSIAIRGLIPANTEPDIYQGTIRVTLVAD